ncbi:MAG: response regulator [Lachnospiraceae bacterium]|nr:response regulator [Lachnospiraceae bacterium]
MYGIHQGNYKDAAYFQGERIMVVDDSETSLEMLDLILKDFGLAPDIFINGGQALKQFFRKNEFYYHFILIDINMYGVDGYETIKQIRSCTRKDGKSIPIFVMTAELMDTDSKMFEEYGINGHIDKPVNFHILYQKIKEEFERKKNEVKKTWNF